MKAEDTVVYSLQAEKKLVGLKLQAEISFKAGQESVFNSMPENLPPLLETAHRTGVREVVELIDKTGLIEHTDSPLHETGATILDCPACCWYTYKKEWGIDDNS